MATDPPSSQRVYRAACPNCGAPVEFRSAAAPFAVCGFCRSTVVREADGLRKIGESAEVFDDHSPLQIGVTGQHQGAPFTLVGRLQYRYADGTWNEWHALFDAGGGDGDFTPRSGWLADDNGRYVIAFDSALRTQVPPPEQLRPGAPLTVNDERWTVASVVAARLIAAQGELPKRPELDRAFVVADLRSSRDDVATIDYSDPAHPGWSIGRPVELSSLALSGLAEGGGGAGGGASEKTLSGRPLTCPNCGAPNTVELQTTLSIVCHQCKSVIDVSQGIGGDLAHYQQAVGSDPLIPLGTVGTLALGSKRPLPWQVVGYVERCEVAESDEDEQTFWREYLLYHRGEGFAFLVDADDGWSSAIPITGAPEGSGDTVRWQGTTYRKRYDYTGRITFVLGEFYWKLVRDQRTANSDYQGTGKAQAKTLNRERTSGEGVEEVVWSAGESLSADAIVAAFRLPPAQLAAIRRDSGPSAFKASWLVKAVFWLFLIVIVFSLFRCGSGDGGTADCNAVRSTFGEASQEYQSCLQNRRSGSGYRSGGGSYGGYSSGGGHK